MESIGKRLERLRKAKKMTIKELAAQIGVPATTYRDWEYGSGIKGEPYLKLAEAFGVSLAELMGVSRPSQEQLIAKIQELKDRVEELEKGIQTLF